MSQSFTVIDVETANSDFASICAIGIVDFKDGQIVSTWSKLIDPEEWFDNFHIHIHRIEPWMVKGKPKFSDIESQLSQKLKGKVVCSYTHFDQSALNQVYDKYDRKLPEYQFLNIARVARRVWTEFSVKGWGLANIAEINQIEFDHHDALEDATAAGKVLLKAFEISGLGLADWQESLGHKLPSRFEQQFQEIQDTINPEGPLYGEKIVFTGALSLTREIAAKKAAQAGCLVQKGITKKTTIVVVGDYEHKGLSGHQKSAKHLKAEDYINKGIEMRIISENSFFKMI